jgi:hypothetical protein
MMFVEGRLTRPGWLRLTWQAAAVKDAVRRQGGGLWPSLTATACHVVGNSGRDEKTGAPGKAGVFQRVKVPSG